MKEEEDGHGNNLEHHVRRRLESYTTKYMPMMLDQF
jgi:hypothetical protein